MGRGGRREQSITVFMTKKPKTLFELAVLGWRTVTAVGSRMRKLLSRKAWLLWWPSFLNFILIFAKRLLHHAA